MIAHRVAPEVSGWTAETLVPTRLTSQSLSIFILNGASFPCRRVDGSRRLTTAARQFWRTHAFWPALFFVIVLTILESSDLDRFIAHALYYDATTHHWLGGTNGMWWARDLIHTGGRWLVRLVAAAALVVWATTFFSTRVRSWRRYAGFAFVALVLSTAVVGGLKSITNVDCPWDLEEFGGDRPYTKLFGDRLDSLPRAACFPGAHASSGFALVFGYFLLRQRSRRRAMWTFAFAILAGVAFSIGQEARGAHFLSHDLTSAALVWFIQLFLYVRMLKPEELERNSHCDAGGATQISWVASNS